MNLAEKKLNRKNILFDLSKVYHSFLSSIEWKDELFLKGISEGKNKFLSNAYLHLCAGKYSISNYYSMEAKMILENWSEFKKPGNLVFEHMIPKEKYIQEPCEQMAKDGTLNVDFIYNLLDKFWYTSTITKAEEKSLPSAKVMPSDWDFIDHLSRYMKTKIKLVPNPMWH